MSPTAAVRSAFRLVSRLRSNGLVDVTKYCSEKTGLKVTIADVPGPLVNGYFCLATETDNDDGLPHTLEHLIFMGSKQYPYKGFLDLVANGCLAQGTNAWTDVDHTCYTLTTAGAEGFLVMLPIYLDHVFHPLLTEAQFVTEVHHINGRGEDGGVVYCEMQESESDMDSMVEWAFKKRMYPGGCGYGVETGGRLSNLRTSTNNAKVKVYHGTYYHPRNCEVIITGQIDHEKVFAALDDVERSILEHKLTDKLYQRPWMTPVPALNVKEDNGIALEEVVLTCPSDEGKSGVVVVGWRGPPIKNYYEVMAFDVALEYLSESAVSPLERDFIQLADPFCSRVDAGIEDNAETCIKIGFEGVKLERLKAIRPRLMQTLGRIANGEEPIDMSRMDDILRQAVLKVESKMEVKPHSTVSDMVIKDFLYGDSLEDSIMRLDDVTTYEKLRKENKDFWVALVREYLVERRPHICVIGEPNKAEVKRLTNAERTRVKEQKRKLGQKGLAEWDTRLKEAIKENEKNKPPPELLQQCTVNTLDGIKYFSLHSTTNRSLEEDGNPNFALSDLPITTLLDDYVGTNFVRLNVQLDTSHLNDELKPLLLLWCNLLFESPILRNGEIVQYDRIVTELCRDLVSYSASPGISDSFYRVVCLNINIDADRFKVAIEWINQLLYSVQFDVERIRVIAQRLINSAAEYKRDGDSVARFLINHLSYEARSPALLYDVIRQEKYLMELLDRMDKVKDEVLDKLNAMRNDITKPGRLVMHLLCDSEKLKQLNANSTDVLSSSLLPPRFTANGEKHRGVILSGKEPTYLLPMERFCRGVIASVGSCESSFVYQCAPCPLDYNDPDLPALKVLLQYLTQCEGPLWRGIRGRGLSYGVHISYKSDERLLTFGLYRTTDPVAAYEETKRLVVECLKEGRVDRNEFEAAKRSLVFEVVGREGTIKGAAAQSLLSYYRGVSADYNRQLVQRIWHVEAEQLPKVGLKYLTDLFDCGKSNVAITCHPSKLAEVVSGFNGFGRNLRTVDLDDDEFHIV